MNLSDGFAAISDCFITCKGYSPVTGAAISATTCPPLLIERCTSLASNLWQPYPFTIQTTNGVWTCLEAGDADTLGGGGGMTRGEDAGTRK